MECELIKPIAEAGPTFALLGFVVYALVKLLQTVIERRLAMEEKTLTELVGALGELAKSREEQKRDQAEGLLLNKMILEKLENQTHD